MDFAPRVGQIVRVRPAASQLQGRGLIGRVVDRIDKGEDTRSGLTFVMFADKDGSPWFFEWAFCRDLSVVSG